MKEVLLTPGPTHVPPQVFAAMQRPTMHHRTETFKNELRQCLDGLRALTQTNLDPILLAGSGTAAMECALLNSCQIGDQVMTINAGKFGERWRLIAEHLALNPIEVKVAWGEAADASAIEDQMRRHPNIKAVCLQHCETSTAVMHPIEKICAVAKRISPEIVTIVDAVSSIGTVEINPQEMQVDILVCAAHKGLMLPPGLAMLFISPLAWKVIEKTPARTLYFNLLVERAAYAKGTTAWTPAMNHILALNASLAMIQAEGVAAVFLRHDRLATALRNALVALGLGIYSKAPSPGVTAAVVPTGIDAETLRGVMLREHCVRVAGGQDEVKGRVIRFGHMGYVTYADLQAGVTSLEGALHKLGHKCELGRGSATFVQSYLLG